MHNYAVVVPWTDGALGRDRRKGRIGNGVRQVILLVVVIPLIE